MGKDSRQTIFSPMVFKLPAGYDWRQGSTPDADLAFRVLDGLSKEFSVTILRDLPIPPNLPESLAVVPYETHCKPGDRWYDWTLRIARWLQLSGLDWAEVSTSNSPACLRVVRRMIRDADIFLLFASHERAWYLNAYARMRGKKVVYDALDDPFWCTLGNRHGVRTVWGRVLWAVKAGGLYVANCVASRCAHLLICSHEGHKEVVCRSYGIAPRKVVVVHPPVNESLPAVIGDLRAELGLRKEDFVVVYLGNFTTGSNRDALRFLQEHIAPGLAGNSRVRFLIIGRVPDELRIQRPNIIYTGFVPEPNRYLAKSDLGISPIWTAGGTIETKVTYYLMMGLPVLCTRERGDRFATSAVRVIPVRQFAAEIQRLADDPAECARMRLEARRHYTEHYSVAAHERDMVVLAKRLQELTPEH